MKLVQFYGKLLLPKVYRLVNTGPNGFPYHRVREIVWSVLKVYGRVTKIIWSVLEMYGFIN